MRIVAKVTNSQSSHTVDVATDGAQHPITIAPKASGLGSSVNGGKLLFGACDLLLQRPLPGGGAEHHHPRADQRARADRRCESLAADARLLGGPQRADVMNEETAGPILQATMKEYRERSYEALIHCALGW
jgi:hypothetical protein